MALTREDEAGTGTTRPGPLPAATTAADVMIRTPKTLPAGATVAQADAALVDDHVHMLLLVDGGTLHGTVLRADLAAASAPDAPALAVARLQGRTVGPDENAEAVRRGLVDTDRRRVAVVTDTHRLLGLVCLKRDRSGFCSDEGVARRAAGGPDPC